MYPFRYPQVGLVGGVTRQAGRRLHPGRRRGDRPVAPARHCTSDTTLAPRAARLECAGPMGAGPPPLAAPRRRKPPAPNPGAEMTVNFAMIATGRIADNQLAPAVAEAEGGRLWSVFSRDRGRAADFAARARRRVPLPRPRRPRRAARGPRARRGDHRLPRQGPCGAGDRGRAGRQARLRRETDGYGPGGRPRDGGRLPRCRGQARGRLPHALARRPPGPRRGRSLRKVRHPAPHAPQLDPAPAGCLELAGPGPMSGAGGASAGSAPTASTRSAGSCSRRRAR